MDDYMYSVEEFVARLEEYDHAYYNTDEPLVSDQEYDMAVLFLRQHYPDHPYLNKVGAKVLGDKIQRKIPMGTLSKYHEEAEVVSWLDREGGDILIAPKYDGFAIELEYVEGKLWSASTRGTGYEGEYILEAVKHISSIPQDITNTMLLLNVEKFTVRGEAIIPKKYYEEVKSLGYNAMRNAVPGIVRSCQVQALKYVDFVAYEFIYDDKYKKRSAIRWMLENVFNVEDFRLYSHSNLEGFSEFRELVRKEDYLYEVDGVVLKTDSILEDDLLHPKHMIAWKYPSQYKQTILREVIYQLGATGAFTPIAVFDEVEFQGAKLSRASLGNLTRMDNEFKGLTVGSMIEVSRRGDIIPYVENVVEINYVGNPIQYPTVCPHCGHPTTKMDEDSVELKCLNSNCPEINKLKISSFVKAVGVKGLGDAVIRSLIDGGHIKEFLDIYRINPEVIMTLPRQGQSAVNKWRNFQERMLNPLELLSAYPFENLGKQVWRKVLEHFNYEELVLHDIGVEDIKNKNIKGLGDSKITSIVSQIKSNLNDLQELGIIHQLF